MGGKTTTSTSQVQIPPDVLARYNAVNTRAEDVAQKPFQIYSTDPSDFVAQINQQQQAGISNVNAAAGYAQPFVQAGTAATAAGMGPANLGELNVDKYMSPYLSNVVQSTADLLNQQNQQAMSGQLGTAIRSGAFGGDRSGIAAANLAQQQRMADASIFSGLLNQGFSQAQGVAQQQQGAGLSADQANLARLMAGGQQIAGLGAAGQQAALQGAGAQMEAGALGQQTEQAGLTSLYNQFMQQQAYPFQVAQFLANVAMGTGALSGSTTTTTQPAPFFSDRRLKEGIRRVGKTDDGMPIYTYRYKGDPNGQTHMGLMADEVERRKPEAVGLAAGYKTVDYDRATKAGGGGVAGAYGAPVGSSPYASSYVPQAYLPVGELMIADPVEMDLAKQGFMQQMASAAKAGENIVSLRDSYRELSDMGKEFFGQRRAFGGGVKGPDRDEGPDQPVTTETPLTGVLASQEKQDKPTLQPAGAQQGGGGGGGVGGFLAGAGSFASGMAQLLPILGFSDRRLKEDIRRVGEADNGLPIYTYRFKGDDSGQTHMGFMADEVEDRRPEAVGLAGGYKAVDYDRAARAYGGLVGRSGYQTGGIPRGGIYPVSPAIADELYMEGAVRPRVIDRDLVPPEPVLHTPGGLVPPGNAAYQTGGTYPVSPAIADELYMEGAVRPRLYQGFEAAPDPGLRPRRNPVIEGEAREIADAAMEALQPRTIEVVDAPIRPAQPMGGVAPAARPAPSGGLAPAAVEEAERRGLLGGLADALSNEKPYEERNAIGRLMYDPKTNKISENALLSILSGIGTMASSPSLYLGGALLQGVGGFANTMAGLREQEARIGGIEAQTEQTKVATDLSRFFDRNGLTLYLPHNNQAVTLYDYLANPEKYSTGDPEMDSRLREEARKRMSDTTGGMFNPSTERERAMFDPQGAQAQTRLIDERVRTAGAEAISGLPDLLATMDAVSRLTSGTGAGAVTTAIGAANSLLQAFGYEPISDQKNAAEVTQKMAALRAAMTARGADQSSFQALEQMMMTNPSVEFDPKTNATLLSSIMLENQKKIDASRVVNDYLSDPRNQFKTLMDFERQFAESIREKHIKEKPILERIILSGQVGGNTAISILKDPYRSPEDKAAFIQAVVGMGPNGISISPEDAQSILRYFGG
jgi:hypothetical protein